MRAAQDALSQVFPTPEKQSALGKVYQANILDHCRDVILRETPKTLSDERSISAEDSEAIYARVISSCIGLLSDLVTSLTNDDTQKQHGVYHEILSADGLWSLLSSKDIQVRRNLYKLLKIVLIEREGPLIYCSIRPIRFAVFIDSRHMCLRFRLDLIRSSIETICHNVLAKQTIRHQTGSALDFSDALIFLSDRHPEMWNTFDRSKTSGLERMQNLFKHGSHAGPSQTWSNLSKLAHSMPTACLPTMIDQVEDLLNAVVIGITRKDEPRSNLEISWSCYFDLTALFTSKLSEEDRILVFSERCLRIILQYIRPAPENSQHSLQGTNARIVIRNALCNSAILKYVEKESRRLAESLIEDIKTSAPEQSKDFRRSQDQVLAESERLFSLQAEILQQPTDESVAQEALKTLEAVFRECLDLLKTRNGKPYGAAGCIEAALEAFKRTDSFQIMKCDSLKHFVLHDLTTLVFSPSQIQLFSILYRFRSADFFEDVWKSIRDLLLGSAETAEKRNSVLNFVCSEQIPPNFEMINQSSDIQDYLLSYVTTSLGSDSDWSFLEKLTGSPSPTLSPVAYGKLLSEFSSCLLDEGKAGKALTGLRVVLLKGCARLRSFSGTEQGSNLMQSLLRAEESSDDDIAQEASSISRQIQTGVWQNNNSGLQDNPSLVVLRRNLYEANDHSLSVSTTVQLAQRLLRPENSERSLNAIEVMPEAAHWLASLREYASVPPADSLAITNPSGTVFLVERADGFDAKPECATFDEDGFSPLLRMARFVVELAESFSVFHEMNDRSAHVAILSVLYLTVFLVRDQLDHTDSNGLWLDNTPGIREEMEKFHVRAEGLILSLLTSEAGDDTFFAKMNHSFLKESSGDSAWAFHNARAFCTITRFATDQKLNKRPDDADLENMIKDVRRGHNIILSAFQIEAFGSTFFPKSKVIRVVNELVSDLTELNAVTHLTKALSKLIHLNLLFHNAAVQPEDLAKQRLIFYIKHIIPWLASTSSSVGLQVELCHSLNMMLPSVIDVYGEHWAQTVRYISSFWLNSSRDHDPYLGCSTLPLMYATLELFQSLMALCRSGDAAEDLPDAINESRDSWARGLLKLIEQAAWRPDDTSRPLERTNASLAGALQLVGKLPQTPEMFPFVNSKPQSLQYAVFALLRSHIRGTQQEISVNAALDKATVRLPEELVSLIIQAPEMSLLEVVTAGEDIPMPARTYLSSWLLVFDHFAMSVSPVDLFFE